MGRNTARNLPFPSFL